MQCTIMRYMRRQSSDNVPTRPMCHTPEDHLTRLALSKGPATVTKHCAKAVGLLMGHSLDSVKPRKHTHTPSSESLLLETSVHLGQDISV